jgi:hypothetical protein
MKNLLSNNEIVMKKDNLQSDNLLDNLQHTILARKEFPTALEQAQFALTFTDDTQALLVHTKKNG